MFPSFLSRSAQDERADVEPEAGAAGRLTGCDLADGNARLLLHELERPAVGARLGAPERHRERGAGLLAGGEKVRPHLVGAVRGLRLPDDVLAIDAVDDAAR